MSDSRDQAHAVTVALDAVAVIFDIVKPVRAAGNLDAASGNTKVKRFKHAPEIGACIWHCESGHRKQQLDRPAE